MAVYRTMDRQTDRDLKRSTGESAKPSPAAPAAPPADKDAAVLTNAKDGDWKTAAPKADADGKETAPPVSEAADVRW